MRYMGGKLRLVPFIVDKINNISICEGINDYYEPFCGGCAVGEKVNIKNKYCNDINKYLIALFKKLQEKEMFEYPNITKEEYNEIRYNRDNYEDWFNGYVGFSCSFNGKFFCSWGGDYTTKEGEYVNAQRQCYNSLILERQYLKDINFSHGSYKDLDIKKHSIIYCDAPYIGTSTYRGTDAFDFDAYYKWLKEISKDNFVLISEYRMPSDDFIEIDCIEVDSNMHRHREGSNNKTTKQGVTKRATEKLFVVKGGWLVDKYFSNDNQEDLLDLI